MPRRKMKKVQPIIRAKQPRTRMFHRSWAERSGNAAASTPGRVVLQVQRQAEHQFL